MAVRVASRIVEHKLCFVRLSNASALQWMQHEESSKKRQAFRASHVQRAGKLLFYDDLGVRGNEEEKYCVCVSQSFSKLQGWGRLRRVVVEDQ